MSKEVLDEIDDSTEDNNDESDSGGIPKYVYLSVILLFKIFAFTHHINQNNPSDQSNPSDNKPSISEKVDTSISEKVDTSSFESIHAFLYSHDGMGHIIFDVVIYVVFVILFLIVSWKLICSLCSSKVWTIFRIIVRKIRKRGIL